MSSFVPSKIVEVSPSVGGMKTEVDGVVISCSESSFCFSDYKHRLAS